MFRQWLFPEGVLHLTNITETLQLIQHFPKPGVWEQIGLISSSLETFHIRCYLFLPRDLPSWMYLLLPRDSLYWMYLFLPRDLPSWMCLLLPRDPPQPLGRGFWSFTSLVSEGPRYCTVRELSLLPTPETSGTFLGRCRNACLRKHKNFSMFNEVDNSQSQNWNSELAPNPRLFTWLRYHQWKILQHRLSFLLEIIY